jgi:hypothetical protein
MYKCFTFSNDTLTYVAFTDIRMKETQKTYSTKYPSSSCQLMGAYDQFSNKHKRKPRPQGAQTDNAVFAADKAGEDTLLSKLLYILGHYFLII